MSEQEIQARNEYAQRMGWKLRIEKSAYSLSCKVTLLPPDPNYRGTVTEMNLPIEYSLSQLWRAFGSSLPSEQTATQQNAAPRRLRRG